MAIRATCAALLLLIVAGAGPASAVVLRCEPKERWVCAMGYDCKSNAQLRVPIDTWALYDTDRKSYGRCGVQSCDWYGVTETRSGVFTNIEIPGKAAFAKIGPEGVFVEVISQVTGVWISYGRCTVAPLP